MSGPRRSPTVLDRLLPRAPARLQPAAARRVASVAAAGALVVATAVALQPTNPQRSSVSRVVSLGVRIPEPQPAGARPRAIRATLRVTTARPGAQVEVLAVTGPHLREGMRVRSATGRGGSQVVTVSAVVDCRSPSALDAASARYAVMVRTTGLDGTSTRSRLPVPGSDDWTAAIRQDCWQRVAAAMVRVDSVVAAPGPVGRDALLDVRLTSTLDRDVKVAAVDVADVSTIEPADSGLLPARGSRLIRVRLQVPDCALRPREFDSELMWSVGGVGEDAAAIFVTALPPSAAAAVVAAARDQCPHCRGVRRECARGARGA